MKRSIRNPLLLLAVLMASAPVHAQHKLDIIQVWGQFAQANHAASKCIKPEPDTLSRFLANFKIVTIRATEEMRKRNPGISEQQVVDSFKKGSDAVGKAIDDVLSVNGCTDPRIQDLLKRFEIQANLKW